MADQAKTTQISTSNVRGGRGRGRGKSRGGLGKYLRARGRGGHGLGLGGRPAEFSKRLLLDGEGPSSRNDDDLVEKDEKDKEEEEEEVAREKAVKYSRRQLGSNIDRYAEPEPELDSDGEPIVEPEVDLSTFLERQKISDSIGPLFDPDRKIGEEEEEEVDTSLAHISSKPTRPLIDKKGKVQQIEWDASLEKLSRDKASAEAAWDLKARFRAKSEKLRQTPVLPSPRYLKNEDRYEQAPPLPLPDGSIPIPKDPKAEMEEFLDDLLG